MALVASGQLTIVDQTDIAALNCVLTDNGQPLQQTYDAPNYSPDRTGSPLEFTPKIYKPSSGSAEDITLNATTALDLSNIKWGTTQGGSELNGTTSFGIGNTTFPFKCTFNTNTFVTNVSGNQNKTVYFQADYTDATNGTTQTVYARVNLSVVVTGTTAVFVGLQGATVIDTSADPINHPAYTVIAANLYRGSTLDTSLASGGYQWRVAPYGIADVLDANHALVTAGKVKFKTSARIDLNEFDDTNTTTAPVDNGIEPGTFADVRGLVIYETAITTGSIAVKAFIKDGSDTVNAFTTVYDRNDPLTFNLFSTNSTLSNGTGSSIIYPIVTYNDLRRNIQGWTFKYLFNNADGTRGAIVTGESRLISANTTSTITCAAFTTAPTTGTALVKVVAKNGTVRYYSVNPTGTTTTNIVLNTGSTVQTTYDWVDDSLCVAPTASQFVGGYISLCGTSTANGSLITQLLSETGTVYDVATSNSFAPATRVLTIIGTTGWVAGDVVCIRKLNFCRYFEIAGSAANSVTLKARSAAHTNEWAKATGPYSATAAGYNDFPNSTGTGSADSAKIVKITSTQNIAISGFSALLGIYIDGYDIDKRGTITVLADKP